MTRYFKTNELRHHGINGQKWGVRNGPPYPLDRETHTKVVREGYTRDRELANAGKLSNKKTVGRSQMWERMDRRWKEVVYASNLDEPTNVADLLMDPNEVKNFINPVKNGRQFVSEWDIKNVNDGGPKEPGQSHNCSKCTAALEMRRRGYNVYAGRSFKGTTNDALSYWFDNVTKYKEKGLDAFCERVGKVLGNNGSAEVDFSYPSGGGHSMYAYYNDDGTFYVADGQTGYFWWSKKVSGQSPTEQVKGAMELVKNYYGYDMDNKYSGVTRLDTGTPNLKHMSEDSVLRAVYNNPIMNQMVRRTDGQFGGEMFDVKNPDGSRNYGYNNVTKEARPRGPKS